ncbi:HET domain-containing protein [Diaporthe amygdali]|uniref:HET domain-containing protein n=1 Tax=Phomopsis amygdali TaxID=1214568 RepID=UPI0022FEE798|nr:HET domain-containing protein [Diaporthe amygdali]KAJ0108686.1 HET domain-containing protein [Diaporthe amygdali]
MKQLIQGASFPGLLDDPYQYEPLIAVRILVLEPADYFQSPLRCSITQYRRTVESENRDGCDYSAISYTWGHSDLSHRIYIRLGAQSWVLFRITESVDSLLRHFRVSHKARLLWIDAICLTQVNEIEKTQQIPLMGRIYSDAKRVHIWLGDDEVIKARQAFRIIRQIEREEQQKINKEETECLVDFFNRPWFTRRWTIQEAVFSHDAILHCGFYKLGLSRVMTVLRKIYGVRQHALASRGSRMLLSSIGLRQTSRKGLLLLLWDLHESECSDPRDRIAAVYALASGPVWPLRHYDSSSWREMYTDVACYYINRTAIGLHKTFPHLCDFGSMSSGTGKGPSWVPNWSSRRQEPLPDMVKREVSKLPYRAFLQMRGDWTHEMQSGWTWFFEVPSSHRISVREGWEQYQLRLHDNPFLMRSEASRQRLRVECHPLKLFQQCGIADYVCSSTAPSFWQEIIEAFDPSELAQHEPVEVETCLSSPGSLLMLLAKTLAKKDKAAGRGQHMASYVEKIWEGLNSHHENPDFLSNQHKIILQGISSSLRPFTIVRIQTIAGSYWAIGPPNSMVGDWMIPLLPSKQNEFTPGMCLRPIDRKRFGWPSDCWGPSYPSRAPSVIERCQDILRRPLHLTAMFVGPASNCGEAAFRPPEEEKKKVLEILMKANEVARGEGLPGPIVFDIV